MYGDAMAIAAIADLARERKRAESYRRKAEAVRRLVEERLWDDAARFYKTVPRGERTAPANVREEVGFIPWHFGLPRAGREVAWAQLTDPNGFAAPFGPMTAERRHSRFNERRSHECLWNGPSWPCATTQTLVALANRLSAEGLTSRLDMRDYFALLLSYARAQHLTRPDGTVVPWIDEDLDPDSGRWIAREILHALGRPDRDRGRDYNHSGFCDLVVTGLVGLHPRADRVVEVNPLVPQGSWDSFCLDGVPDHGRQLTILDDRDGRRYGRGAGLRVLVDGVEVAAAGRLGRLTGELPTVGAPAAPAVAGARQERPTADGLEEGAAGWRKFADNPVLGINLGTCFDVSLLREGPTDRMWFSWRPKKAVALVEGADGVHRGPPVIVLGSNPRTGGMRTSTARSWSSGQTATTF
jgi:Mannosylglycerate hydrolase MGH1-like glycoside hydrolase domain